MWICNGSRNGNPFFCTLSRLGTLLAIAPYYSSDNSKDTNGKHYWYKCYSVFVCFVMINTCGLFLFGRFSEVHSNFPSYALMITNIASNASILTTSVITILVSSFLEEMNFLKFMKNCCEIEDYCFKNGANKNKGNPSHYINLIGGHVIFLCIAMYDAYVWLMQEHTEKYRFYSIRCLHYYHLYIIAITICKYATLIKDTFKNVNQILIEVIACESVYENASDAEVQVEMNRFERSERVREISSVYKNQLEQINIFNSIFSWQIFLLAFTIIVQLFDILGTFALYSYLLLKVNDDKYGKSTGIHLITTGFLWSLWQLLLGTIIAVLCNQVEEEVQITENVCFDALLKLPLSQNLEEKTLRYELNLLKEIIVYRYQYLMNVGVFSIKYFLLLVMFQCVVSYAIILIQLN